MNRRLAKLWLAAGAVLILALALAFYFSPFVHASGAFAGFEKSRAIPAGLIGICGTALIMIWGWLLLRKSDRDKDCGSRP